MLARQLTARCRCELSSSRGDTGVLVYVSLYEHMARVVGDDAVTEKISREDWEGICRLVVDGMKADNAVLGLALAKGILCDVFRLRVHKCCWLSGFTVVISGHESPNAKSSDQAGAKRCHHDHG